LLGMYLTVFEFFYVRERQREIVHHIFRLTSAAMKANVLTPV